MKQTEICHGFILKFKPKTSEAKRNKIIENLLKKKEVAYISGQLILTAPERKFTQSKSNLHRKEAKA